MSKDSFDDIIREKMSRVTPHYQAGDWERLKERLDDSHLSEQEDMEFFDRMVRNKAPRFNEAGLSHNWTSLMARLDHIYLRERQVLTAKILELVALFFLVIVIDRDFALSPVSNSIPSSPEYFAVSTPPATPQSPSDQNQLRADAPFRNPTGSNTVLPVVSFTDESNLDPVPSNGTLRAATSKSISLLPSLSLSLQGSQTADEEKTIAGLMPKVSLELVSSLSPRVKPSRESLSTAPGKIIRMRSKLHFSLSMFGSTDFNRIITPAYTSAILSSFDRTQIYVPVYDRYAMGYSGGLALAFGKQNWEVESGLMYTAKQYQARPVVYVTGSVQDGYFGEGLKDIEMNIAAIPVTLRYDLYNRKGWRAYSGIGASMQIVLESNYSVADQDAFRSRTFNPSPSLLDSPGLLKSAGLSNKNLDGGWLQGGSFADNSFISAQLSFGVERRFWGNWSIFAQPNYYHSVIYLSKGLGPDYERLHTFSLLSGVRIRL